MASSDEAPARLFIALWPDALARRELSRCRDIWRWPHGARPVPDARLHLTLHFIGRFARGLVAGLNDALTAVPSRTVVLLRPSGAELWRGGVAVLRFRAEPALHALHGQIGAALSGVGVALETRPFAPHVTMARNAAGAEPPSLESADFE